MIMNEKVKKLNEKLEQQYIQQEYKLLTKDDVKKLTLECIFEYNHLALIISENEYTEKELKNIKSKLGIKSSVSTIEIPILPECEVEEISNKKNKNIFCRTNSEYIFSDVYFVSHDLRFYFTPDCYEQACKEKQDEVRDIILNK